MRAFFYNKLIYKTNTNANGQLFQMPQQENILTTL